MDITGVALSSLTEVRALVKSLRQRYDRLSSNQNIFNELLDDLERINNDVKECDRKLKKILPQEGKEVMEQGLLSIQNYLLDSKKILEELQLRAFQKGASGKSDLVSEVSQGANTNQICGQLEKVSEIFRQVVEKVLSIAAHFGTCDLSPKIYLFCEADKHLSTSSVPVLNCNEILHFDSKGNDGNWTPEALLKRHVLGEVGNEVAKAFDGVGRQIEPVYIVEGVAGVGKTVALKGLAAQKEIQDAFQEVHYLILGHDATPNAVVSELERIVRISGGRCHSYKLGKCKDVTEAVQCSIEWFSARKCLFLIDDVRKTTELIYGYLPMLRQLLSSCEESRMVISTRDRDISNEVGQVIKFGSRDVYTSRQIFLNYLCPECPQLSSASGRAEGAIKKILNHCAGLPLALSIAGRGAKAVIDEGETAESALHIYEEKLEEGLTDFAEGLSPEYGAEDEMPSLRAAIDLSLGFLDKGPIKDKIEREHGDISQKHSIRDMYFSLCVLKSPVWVPLSMLKRLWSVSIETVEEVVSGLCTMSLAMREKRSYRAFRSNIDHEEDGLRIHDLQLQYIQQHCQASMEWHRKLLNGYLKPLIRGGCSTGWENNAHSTVTAKRGGAVAAFARNCFPCFAPRKKYCEVVRKETEDSQPVSEMRPWWTDDVPDDGYIHGNLAWHLANSGNHNELRELLLDARWAKLRLEAGGILGLERDFAELQSIHKASSENSNRTKNESIAGQFTVILRALRCSWRYIIENERNLPALVGSGLLEAQRISETARKYMNSVRSHITRPFLEAQSAFLPYEGYTRVTEIHMGGFCHSLAYSTCGKRIVAGAGEDVAIFDLERSSEVFKFKGHKDVVFSVCFLGQSGKVVSGSFDGTVRVWDTNALDGSALVLKGHTDQIWSVCASSDGQRIASGSCDRTIRLWNVVDQAGQCKVLMGHIGIVCCVCFSSSGDLIASGSSDRTIRLWNGRTGDTTGVVNEAHTGWVLSIAFSQDDCRLASGSSDSKVCLWDMRTGAPEAKVLEGHSDFVTSVSFSPDDTRLVSASLDNTVQFWNLCTSTTFANAVECYADKVCCANFSPDGVHVASGSRAGTLCIWDTSKLKMNNKIPARHRGCVGCVAFGQDGIHIATGSYDCTIRLWNARNGAAMGMPLEGHYRSVTCVAFSLDGLWLVSGSCDKTVRLWDVAKRIPFRDALEGHSMQVNCVAFSPDCILVASGSEDNTLRLWNTCTGSAVGDALCGHKDEVIEVAFSVDGTKLISRSEDSLRLWSVTTGGPLWTSQRSVNDPVQVLRDVDAQEIIKNWNTEHVLSSAEGDFVLYCEGSTVMLKRDHQVFSLAELPPLAVCHPVPAWKYFPERSEFVAVLKNGMCACFKVHF